MSFTASGGGGGGDAAFLRRLDGHPVLRGWGVLVLDGDAGRLVRRPQMGPAMSARYLVVERETAPATGAVDMKELVSNGLGALLSCSTAAITGLSAAGSAPVTGGAGLLLMVPAAASAAACGIGIGKTINSMQGSWANKQLEANTAFRYGEMVIDGIQIYNAGKSAAQAVKILRAFAAVRATKAASLGNKAKAGYELFTKPHASAQVRKGLAKELTRLGEKKRFLTREEFRAIHTGLRENVFGSVGDLFGSATSESGVVNKAGQIGISVLELDEAE